MELGGALEAIRAGIAEACRRVGRDPAEVTLVAATKTVPIEVVRQARELGVEHFGENHAAELSTKASAVEATWHFLGKLQRGTAARVASHASVVHSGEPGGGLERLSGRASRSGRSISCLAQVDFTGWRQGVAPERLEAFLSQARSLPGLVWTGLMTLPPWTGRAEATRPFFEKLRDLRDGLASRFPEIRELSMGMSGDYEVAIEEGATMVRIGTALFGERPRGAIPEEP